jgi:transforming growth factor-beta-induced protein
MRSNNLLLAAFATAFATAQDLATVLSGQESLSTLVGLLGQVQNTTEFLASQENVTLFAPSNDAFASIVSEGGIFSIEQAAVDPGLIEQILRYHLFRGVVKAADIKEIPQFVPSYLNYSGFVLDGEVSGSNVTGGQVVSVNLNEEGDAIVTSGIKATSQVVVAVRSTLSSKCARPAELINYPRTSPSTTA